MSSYKYDEKTIKRFKEGVDIIKKAKIYITRIDYLLDGDDGEKSFKERLDEELKMLEYEKFKK